MNRRLELFTSHDCKGDDQETKLRHLVPIAN